jgi:hypothetical protein
MDCESVALLGSVIILAAFLIFAWCRRVIREPNTNAAETNNNAYRNSQQPPIAPAESPQEPCPKQQSKKKARCERIRRAFASRDNWNIGFTGILAIATLLLAFIGFNTDATLRESATAAKDAANVAKRAIAITEGSERAWVGPFNGALTSPPTLSSPVRTEIRFRNTGKQPAVVNVLSNSRLLSLTEWSDGTASNHITFYENSCLAFIFDEMTQDRPFLVAYPGGQEYTSQDSSDRIVPENQRFVIDDNFMRGDAIFIFNGCLVYQSLGKDRHSSFCYYYRHTVSDMAHLTFCRGGQRVD